MPLAGETQDSNLCPSCKKIGIPKHILPRPEEVKEVGMTQKTAWMIGCILLICVGFAIGLGVSMRGH